MRCSASGFARRRNLVILGSTQPVVDRRPYSSHHLKRFTLRYTCQYSGTCVSQLELVKGLSLMCGLVREEPRCED